MGPLIYLNLKGVLAKRTGKILQLIREFSPQDRVGSWEIWARFRCRQIRVIALAYFRRDVVPYYWPASQNDDET